MKPWVKSFRPFAESLLEPFGPLPHFLVWVRAPATAAGEPSPQASRFISAALQNPLIASGRTCVVKLVVRSLGLHG